MTRVESYARAEAWALSRAIDCAMPSGALSTMVDHVIVLTLSLRHHTSQRYIPIVEMRDRQFDARTQPFPIGERGLALGVDSLATGSDQAN